MAAPHPIVTLSAAFAKESFTLKIANALASSRPTR